MPVNFLYARTILRALNVKHPYGVRHIYAGTVPQHVIDARRATNKRARIARRANRG